MVREILKINAKTLVKSQGILFFLDKKNDILMVRVSEDSSVKYFFIIAFLEQVV